MTLTGRGFSTRNATRRYRRTQIRIPLGLPNSSMQVRIRGYRDRRVTKSSGDRFEIRAGGEHYRRVQRVIFGHVTASKRRLRAYEANAPVCHATGDRKVAPSGGAVCLGLRAGKSHTTCHRQKNKYIAKTVAALALARALLRGYVNTAMPRTQLHRKAFRSAILDTPSRPKTALFIRLRRKPAK